MLQPDSSPPIPDLDNLEPVASADREAPAPASPPTMLRAGAKLAFARKAMGLTVEQVSDKLRISRDYITALEAMNLKLIPGKAYARAFAKSYARLVGLDPDAIVAQFEDENALTREDIAPQIRNPASKPARERPWLAALAIAVAIAGFIGWRVFAAREGDPRLVEPPTAPVVLETARRTPSVAAATAVVVEIRALTPAWLEVRGPEGTIFISQVIEPGQAYRPDVGGGWTIHARDGGAFEVAVAGQVVGPLGKAGAPVLGRSVDAIVAEAAEAAAAKAVAAQAPTPAPAASPRPDASAASAPQAAAPAPAQAETPAPPSPEAAATPEG